MFGGFTLEHIDTGEATLRVRYGGGVAIVVAQAGVIRVLKPPPLTLVRLGLPLAFAERRELAGTLQQGRRAALNEVGHLRSFKPRPP